HLRAPQSTPTASLTYTHPHYHPPDVPSTRARAAPAVHAHFLTTDHAPPHLRQLGLVHRRLLLSLVESLARLGRDLLPVGQLSVGLRQPCPCGRDLGSPSGAALFDATGFLADAFQLPLQVGQALP